MLAQEAPGCRRRRPTPTPPRPASAWRPPSGAKVPRAPAGRGCDAVPISPARRGCRWGCCPRSRTARPRPRLTTLQALAAALNVPISMFFQDFEDRRDCSYVPAGQGVRIDRRGTRAGHVYELLGHSLRSATKKSNPSSSPSTEGVPPMTPFSIRGMNSSTCCRGRVTYRHGDRHYDLGPGDALFFDALAPPRAGGFSRTNARENTCRIIVTPPPD